MPFPGQDGAKAREERRECLELGPSGCAAERKNGMAYLEAARIRERSSGPSEASPLLLSPSQPRQKLARWRQLVPRRTDFHTVVCYSTSVPSGCSDGTNSVTTPPGSALGPSLACIAFARSGGQRKFPYHANAPCTISLRTAVCRTGIRHRACTAATC